MWERELELINGRLIFVDNNTPRDRVTDIFKSVPLNTNAGIEFSRASN